MLSYEEIIPELRLQSYVRKFWVLDNLTSTLASTEKMALPNTCFTIALVHGNGLIANFPDLPRKIGSGAYFVGELTSTIGITILPNTKAFMIQLNPWTASLLSKFSFHELTNQVSAVTDINKSLAQSLIQVNILDNIAAGLRLSKILEHYCYPTTASAFISGCFELFESHLYAAPFKITELSRSSGYTLRGVEKKFKQHTGLSPKQAYTIIKVRSVVNELIVPENYLSLTALAYRYGYTDQSHFTKTYLQIMDSLPSKFETKHYLLPLDS